MIRVIGEDAVKNLYHIKNCRANPNQYVYNEDLDDNGEISKFIIPPNSFWKM